MACHTVQPALTPDLPISASGGLGALACHTVQPAMAPDWPISGRGGLGALAWLDLGRTEFRGTNPVDPTIGLIDQHCCQSGDDSPNRFAQNIPRRPLQGARTQVS